MDENDKKFRDGCAQAALSAMEHMIHDSQGAMKIAVKAFDLAEAMLDERQRRDAGRNKTE